MNRPMSLRIPYGRFASLNHVRVIRANPSKPAVWRWWWKNNLSRKLSRKNEGSQRKKLRTTGFELHLRAQARHSLPCFAGYIYPHFGGTFRFDKKVDSHLQVYRKRSINFMADAPKPTPHSSATSQKCAAVPRRARISGTWTWCITQL